LPTDATAQHEPAWANVFAILAAVEMTKTDIVDVLVIISEPSGVPIFRQVRDRMFDGHLAGTTLLDCGLASSDWKVESWSKPQRPTERSRAPWESKLDPSIHQETKTFPDRCKPFEWIFNYLESFSDCVQMLLGGQAFVGLLFIAFDCHSMFHRNS
jgi:hypothetical protein